MLNQLLQGIIMALVQQMWSSISQELGGGNTELAKALGSLTQPQPQPAAPVQQPTTTIPYTTAPANPAPVQYNLLSHTAADNQAQSYMRFAQENTAHLQRLYEEQLRQWQYRVQFDPTLPKPQAPAPYTASYDQAYNAYLHGYDVPGPAQQPGWAGAGYQNPTMFGDEWKVGTVSQQAPTVGNGPGWATQLNNSVNTINSFTSPRGLTSRRF